MSSELQRKKVSIFLLIACIAGYGCYFLMNVFFLLIFPVILFVLWVFPRHKQTIFDALYRFSLTFLTRIWLPFIGIYKIEEDSGSIPPDGKAAILVANHRSRIEGPLIISKLRKTGVIMKSSYAKLPVYSSLVKHNNFISVDPSSLESFAAALDRCKSLLADGYKILVFPEGARARSKRMLPFKDMAFRISIETGIPVIPVIVHTDYPFMAKVKGSIFPPKTMKLTFKALDPVSQLPGERSSDFCERVKMIMVREIKKLDQGTVWETI